MLELARKLADNDECFFGGWIIAGVQVYINGPAEVLQNKTLLAKARKSILEVQGFASEQLVKSLRVFLVLPTGSAVKDSDAAAYDEALVQAHHVFTASEVQDYVAYTGDENIIHKGERPLVPGLCMLAWAQQELALTKLHWRVSFLSPVHAGEELVLVANEAGFTAYANENVAFEIKNLDAQA